MKKPLPTNNAFCLILALGTAAITSSFSHALASEIDFNNKIRPLLSRHCIACHGPDEEDRQAGLRLDTFDGATEDLGGYAAIAPGDPDDSELILRLVTDDLDLRMPPAGHADALEDSEIELLTRWIADGAAYQTHWSFESPRMPTLPDSVASNPSGAIDHFVDEKLAAIHLQRQELATPHALVRRLSLDLTGLPPVSQDDSVQQAIKQYIADPTVPHLGQLADQLMETGAFAEHWASMWLDLARYADTVGYAGDEKRDIWPWRDWLIHAIHENQSYRDMSIAMIAGDLLPNATLDQRLATAFHRNTLSNNEGGTNDEEFRTIAIKDRLSTTLNVWMGLTVRCAECHSHKYDPISHNEYYQLLDFFNQSSDADKRDERPKIAVPPRRDPAFAAELHAKHSDLMQRLPDEDPVWTVQKPTAMESEHGTKFKQLDDNSILAHGTNPDKETYRLTFHLPAGETLQAIRLEAIPHLDHDGHTGRSAEGAFILSQIRLVHHVDDEDRSIAFSDAENDYNQPNNHARTAIKAKVPSEAPNQGWAVRHPVDGFKGHREAVFQLAEPLQSDSETQFTIHLRHDPPWPKLNLGCVRISTCNVPQAAQRYRDDDLEPVRRALQKIQPLIDERVRVPVMEELATEKRRETFVNIRGNFQSRGEKMEADFPEAFHLPDQEFASDRLGLAEWIFSANNPLTARVAVNRYWARMMGHGLVETEEDFGTQGSPPSHPRLLDYLAIHFQEAEWDVRQLLRWIVLSETYRQSPNATEESLTEDPRNRLYSRGPRIRLTAEVVRDQALAVSGLLSQKMYGPPVYPPSPIKRIVNAFTGGMTWKESDGEDRYRRALYTFLKRSSPHPLFETFDMASRDVCNMRRLRTNTPLQSFMTLNDVTFIEAARALAEHMIHAASPAETDAAGTHWKREQTVEAIEHGLKRALSDPVVAPEHRRVLTELFDDASKEFGADIASAREFLGQADAASELSDAETDAIIRHAAMTLVANVILNLDGFLNN